MFKNIFNDLKLNRISYLLETIETDNFRKKVDAYNKLQKMKLNEEAGHLIIEKVSSLKQKNNDEFNIELSLLSLIFKNYYDSYSYHLIEIFKKLNTDTKYEILNILANSNDPSELVLYRTLVYDYYKELKNIPIGNISSNKDNYELLFPELYEIFKKSGNRNNLLLILSDFINAGVVPIMHIKKYKTVLQKIIINIFNEGIKFKIDPKDNFMDDKKYIDLRVFLEVSMNIEYYVSNKETKACIDKLFKTKDNQLKLFILENYNRKGKSITKVSLNSIAKDNLSRYPLYSFLAYNNLQKLMPKKYANNKDLSLSDLYLNFSIAYNYSKVPYDFELVEERVIDGFKYYIYKFKTEFNYNEEVIDPATDYLLKNIKIDKDLINNAETTYLGFSGGYSEDPSLVSKEIDTVKFTKLDDDYEKVLDRLLLSKIAKEEPKKEEKETEQPKVVEKKEEPKEEKVSKIASLIDFSRIFMFTSLLIILLFVVLLLYVSNVDLFGLRKHTLNKNNIIEAVLLKPKDLFSEISYRDIFNKEDPEYYVLFFKKKDKSKYYEFLNILLKNEYKIYYVDLSNKDNKPIYEGNETGFIITGDTLLKVTDREYSFFISGKENIIVEFKSYTDEIKKKEEEAKKQKEKEEQEKKSEETKKTKKKKS